MNKYEECWVHFLKYVKFSLGLQFIISRHSITSTLTASVVITHPWWHSVRFLAWCKEPIRMSRNWSNHLMIDALSALCLRLNLILVKMTTRYNWGLSALCIGADCVPLALAMTVSHLSSWCWWLLLLWSQHHVVLRLLYLINKTRL